MERVTLAALLLAFACKCSAENAKALFVFGDSYADTGNRDPYNASINEAWRRPYGFHWPGYPAGRYSSGKIQTDRWAEILGLPSPIPYDMLKTHECEEIPNKIVHGVNFAFGGSGLFEAVGYITIPDQVKQFKKLMKKIGAFSAHDLARSIVLLSYSGEDYLADNHRNNVTELVSLVSTVVNTVLKFLEELYDYGLRNFVVTEILALGCVPITRSRSCKLEQCVELHSRLLNERIHHLRSRLKGSSIIIPDLPSVFVHIFSNAANYGFEDWYKPCCAKNHNVYGCTDVDEKGGALFKVCDEPNKRFFWDYSHPTHKGWYTIMSLYAYGSVNKGKELYFVKGASNLMEWVKSIGFDGHNMSTNGIDNLGGHPYVIEK